LELFFLGFIVVSAEKGVEIVLLPVLVRSLSPLNLLISLQLILMILQVPTSDDIVVP